MGRSRAGFELLDWGDRRWKHGRDTCPLAAADRSRIAEYRAEQEAHIRRYIAAQTAKG